MFSADLGGYTAPPPPDATNPPFQKVALLLHGDGTNGAQNNTFVDYSYPGGYAVSFDGTGDYLTTPTSTAIYAGTSDFTVEFWMNTSSVSGYLTMISLATYGNGMLIRQQAANLEIFITGSLVYTGSSMFTTNEWIHVAISRQSGTLRVFKNGIQFGSSVSNTSDISPSSYNYIMLGGSIHTAGGENFNGYLSNIRYVVGTALYTSTFTPSNQPLTAVSGTQLLTCQSATIVDNSPNAFTISVYGNAAAVSSKTITRTGNVAQGTFSPFSLAEGQWSNYFDGNGDYLSIGANTAFDLLSSDFTVEFWVSVVNPAATSGGVALCVGSGSGYWQILVRDNAINVNNSPDGSNFYQWQSSVSLTTGWQHVAWTKSSGTQRLFFNGTLLTPTGTAPTSTANNNLFIGANYNGGTTGLNGYISNLRIVKGTALYTSNFTPSTTPLTAITNTSLLTCQSNRFKDNSSNNFTITRNGDTKVTAFSPFAPSAAYSASTNGGSGYFDGSGDYLSMASNAAFAVGTGDFTIEFWGYWNAVSSTTPGNVCHCVNNGTLGIYVTSTQIQLARYNTGGDLIASTTQTTGQWDYYAITRQSNTARIFKNGVQVASGTVTTNYGQNGFQIGLGAASAVNGYISNLRFVNGTALYTANFTPPTAPLTAITNTSLLLNCTNAGIIDNAGKNDIETVGNAQISTSVKKYGTGSMYFDGTGDYLYTKNQLPFITENFTVECWCYISGGSGFRALVTTRTSADGGGTATIWFGVSSGNKFYFDGDTGGSLSITGTTTVSSNTWYHVAVVRNGSTVTLYVNGTSEGTRTDANSKTTTDLWIGGLPSTYQFNGYIDDLRITKGQALYTSNFTPPTQAFPNV